MTLAEQGAKAHIALKYIDVCSIEVGASVSIVPVTLTTVARKHWQSPGPAGQPRAIAIALWFALAMATSGCSTAPIRTEASAKMQAGEYELALSVLAKGLRDYPEDIELKSAYARSREVAIAQLLSSGASERLTGQMDAAEKSARRLLAIDPGNAKARALLLDLERDRRTAAAVQTAEKAHTSGSLDAALALVESALKDNPRHPELLALQQRIELDQRTREESTRRRLAETRPVTLAFREAGLQPLLEALSKATGVNFILDKDVRQDIRATVFLRNTRIEDALELVTRTNQLAMKILDATTVLIYPNTPDKQREYQDLLVRAFYLNSISAKQAAATLQTMLKVRDPVVDERANLVIIRDTPERVRVAERLLALQDFSEPEVMLEVEVLEVNTSRLTELGIRIPDSFSLVPLPASGSPPLTLSDLQNLTSDRVAVTTPTVTLNLRRELGDTNILANPRIRAKNKEKARVLIGDKLPVITSTATSTGFVSENVQYLDVGLKLEVEPLVHLDDEVSMKVNLEVSSLAREIRTAGGSLAYQIGTRSATTTLQLKDGQTQLLAGLISRADRTTSNRIPGLGDLPVLGRLFSSQKDEGLRTEIVLSITPRVIRNIRRPDINLAEFWSGSESHFRVRPLALTTIAQPTAKSDSPAGAAIAPSAAPAQGSSTAGGAVAKSPGRPGSASDIEPQGPPPTNAGTEKPVQVASMSLPSGSQWGLRIDAPANVASGGDFAVHIVARADVAVRGMPVEVVYDSERLTLLDVEEGGLLRQGGAAVSITKQIQPDVGRAVFGVLRNVQDGAKGTGVVATLRFKAQGAGSARVTVQAASAIGAPSGTVAAPLPAPATIEVGKP